MFRGVARETRIEVVTVTVMWYVTGRVTVTRPVKVVVSVTPRGRDMVTATPSETAKAKATLFVWGSGKVTRFAEAPVSVMLLTQATVSVMLSEADLAMAMPIAKTVMVMPSARAKVPVTLAGIPVSATYHRSPHGSSLLILITKNIIVSLVKTGSTGYGPFSTGRSLSGSPRRQPRRSAPRVERPRAPPAPADAERRPGDRQRSHLPGHDGAGHDAVLPRETRPSGEAEAGTLPHKR